MYTHFEGRLLVHSLPCFRHEVLDYVAVPVFYAAYIIGFDVNAQVYKAAVCGHHFV